jgi:DNA-binding LacI/PurR family transcriptional regulator
MLNQDELRNAGMSAKQPITMGDIARLAKVSKPTVSRALSDSPLVNEETKEHVRAVARKHGYAVNRNAQKLRHKRTNTIAVSLDYISLRRNHISDPFIFELLAGVSEALGEENQDLLLCAPNSNNSEAFRQMLASRGADGFIFLGQGHREDMLNEIAEAGAPMVVWGAVSNDTPYSVVGSDNFLGGLLAGRYLLEKQRKRFLFIGDTSFKEFYLRKAGLQKAIEESNQNIVIDNLVPSNLTYEAAFEDAKTYLDNCIECPDAAFAFSDTTAMAFIYALKAHGICVPQTVSVVGYNDIAPARYFSPPITTVRQDPYQAGKLLVSKLMQTLEGVTTSSATIKTQLITRET